MLTATTARLLNVEMAELTQEKNVKVMLAAMIVWILSAATKESTLERNATEEINVITV